jgi:hypothetical protein
LAKKSSLPVHNPENPSAATTLQKIQTYHFWLLYDNVSYLKILLVKNSNLSFSVQMFLFNSLYHSHSMESVTSIGLLQNIYPVKCQVSGNSTLKHKDCNRGFPSKHAFCKNFRELIDNH